jgi:hypothetical protein
MPRAAGHRPPWVVRSLIAAVAVAAAAVVWRGDGGPGTIAPAAGPPVPPPTRVCVTGRGFCPVGPVRAGDPCSCPDLLAGNVPGRVELVGSGAGDSGATRGWPDRHAGDPLDGLGPLVGP